MEGIIYTDADSLLTPPHAEGAAQFHSVLQIMLRNQRPELLHHLTGSLNMAGTSNAYSHFHLYAFLSRIVSIAPIVSHF
jgi:hypothetical protein